jgi:CDP-glucose 4,6-dehydratase
MHFLITGHTGFKGSWLSLMLQERGHEVSGISLEPESDSLFRTMRLGITFKEDIRCDVRDFESIQKHFKRVNPDVVIHLAAQALVQKSYSEPLTTFQTNVMGTINVLKASQFLPNLKAQLIITTDKVYNNVNKLDGYVESDPLGGLDPYSSSKAMADLATQSWLSSFDNPPTAIARAGNVIGGGDVCADRLIPDLVSAYTKDLGPKLRSPNSIRPWQHVLDCLNGYLALVDALLEGKGIGAWNFGPDESRLRTVAEVANIASQVWGGAIAWENDFISYPHEANVLVLNSEKARTQLAWSDKLNFEESVSWTINWYKDVFSGQDPLEKTLCNIREFEVR